MNDFDLAARYEINTVQPLTGSKVKRQKLSRLSGCYCLSACLCVLGNDGESLRCLARCVYSSKYRVGAGVRVWG